MERTAQHVCQYDFAADRHDILRCGLVEDHRVVLLPDRRAILLSELKALGLLVGAALAEAESRPG
jgi:hypothetical protein